MENTQDCRRRIPPIRILLVDDQPLYLETLALVLGLEDRAEVVGRAADGIEGVELALSLRPDVVLMDVHMPRCDGVEAARRLRRELPSLPVVMLSSSSAPEDRERARGAGARAYLTKDVPGSAIVAELARHVVGSEALIAGSAA